MAAKKKSAKKSASRKKAPARKAAAKKRPARKAAAKKRPAKKAASKKTLSCPARATAKTLKNGAKRCVQINAKGQWKFVPSK